MKEESEVLLGKLLLSKTHLDQDLWKVTHPEDKKRILEVLIENAIEDIGIYGKIRKIEGYNEDSVLTDSDLEGLKRKLFLALDIM